MIVKKYITKKNYMIYILIVTLLLLTMPHLTRIISNKTTILPGESTYYHLGIAELLNNNEISVNDIFPDPLVKPTRPIMITPYHLLISYLENYLPIETTTFILLILLGISSVLLFNSILMRFRLALFKRFVIIILMVLSPLFLRTFLIPDQAFVVIFLQLLGFFLYTSKSQIQVGNILFQYFLIYSYLFLVYSMH